MDDRQEQLSIQLEVTRSMWVTMLGLLSSNTQQWRFVGIVDGQPKYTSATFAAPFSWGTVPLGKTELPREEWAPGMAQALDELQREVTSDGWAEDSLGEQPWQHVYHRSH
ncbi:MAG: hypothetical protein WCF36_01200 [Candidatus Nanopelagicales bacterium]